MVEFTWPVKRAMSPRLCGVWSDWMCCCPAAGARRLSQVEPTPKTLCDGGFLFFEKTV